MGPAKTAKKATDGCQTPVMKVVRLKLSEAYGSDTDALYAAWRGRLIGSRSLRRGGYPNRSIASLSACVAFPPTAANDPLELFGCYKTDSALSGPYVETYCATKFIEIEFTQWRVSFGVWPSPVKTCPRWPPQLAQTISVRRPSASGTRSTAP